MRFFLASNLLEIFIKYVRFLRAVLIFFVRFLYELFMGLVWDFFVGFFVQTGSGLCVMSGFFVSAEIWFFFVFAGTCIFFVLV